MPSSLAVSSLFALRAAVPSAVEVAIPAAPMTAVQPPAVAGAEIAKAFEAVSSHSFALQRAHPALVRYLTPPWKRVPPNATLDHGGLREHS
jgi:hypothetical protein